MNLLEIIDKQNEIRSNLGAIAEKAKGESRDFNEDEKRSIDSLKSDLAKLDLAFAEERKKPVEMGNLPQNKEKKMEDTDKKNEVRTFSQIVAEKRAITTGSGNLVQVDVDKDFIQKVAEANFVRADAKKVKLVGKDRMPYITSVGAASILTENGAVSASAEDTASVNFEAFENFKQVPISSAMMNNPFTDTVAMIDDAASAAFTESELNYFVYGTGTGQPQGFAVGGTLRAAVASATALTLAELKALLSSLKPKYRSGAKIYVAADYEAILDTVVDGTGKALYNRELGTILGVPVIVTEFLNKTTNKKPMAYANLAKGYAVADRGNGVERNIFEDAPNKKFGANYSSFIDGRVLIPEAIQVLQTP